ncbi:hypothetical protein PCC7424_3200 [Gloeothece citriformis PCC 7424]|uniref:Dynamin family protein n=1 Tax=Gloeothece citriformis (strain PCC 7424) TaxID=65393 RepID=B7KCQ0_GLOC7|nr:hypothetical protein [Gloeothece citriformis]ACK71601.1 hypothetical protein PCC7424_3200 [Gloeothece citriformis PCC 7424]
MDEYLKTLQSLSQSIAQALQNPQNSPEEKRFVSHLSNSVNLCANEISKSANILKKIVDVSLEDLNKAEAILQNYYKISREVSPLTPLEEIGKLSGCQVKLLELIEESKKEVFEQLKESWEEDLENLKKRWFIDKEGKLKKGIGWIEKDNFIEGIKVIKLKQISEFMKNLQHISKLIFFQLDSIVNFNDIKDYLQILDYEKQKKYQDSIDLILKKINGYQNQLFLLQNNNEELQDFKLKMNVICYPILENKWGELSWNSVRKTKSQYNTIIESFINEIIQKKADLIKNLVETLIQLYNEFLQKQAFYNQQSPEEQQAKQEWVNAQRKKLETLQSSLDNVISFQL